MNFLDIIWLVSRHIGLPWTIICSLSRHIRVPWTIICLLSRHIGVPWTIICSLSRHIGVPGLRKVRVFNINSHSSIQMLSISGNTIHFHCSFFSDKVENFFLLWIPKRYWKFFNSILLLFFPPKKSTFSSKSSIFLKVLILGFKFPFPSYNGFESVGRWYFDILIMSFSDKIGRGGGAELRVRLTIVTRKPQNGRFYFYDFRQGFCPLTTWKLGLNFISSHTFD